jgi:hypothetical protein
VHLFLQQVKRYKTAGQALKNGRLGAIKWQVTCHYLQQQVQFFCGRSVFSIFSNDVIFWQLMFSGYHEKPVLGICDKKHFIY